MVGREAKIILSAVSLFFFETAADVKKVDGNPHAKLLLFLASYLCILLRILSVHVANLPLTIVFAFQHVHGWLPDKKTCDYLSERIEK